VFKSLKPEHEAARLQEIEETERRLALEKQRILEGAKANSRSSTVADM
jgi:hypothetical protein